ncbi:M20/M25/M40 family metallo-hydrolase [Segetibacter sp. 3557_3]|uniref:M20 family metallo-hydrolase n=1 Tax=Segetibacter sp. 3557_3 TaxID=2547429 RepID=UPI001058FDD7|nr:M20 family metallo-hydrolase [Segetibacter sp. 3557_3]TDH25106.1 M20/M25/M40 family metallo-hydrolase [Segetibacter sp. 3557_3]
MSRDLLYEDAVRLIKDLISVPSFSRSEDGTAAVLVNFLEQKGISTQRHLNNIWAVNRYFDPSKPSILLNSHHDTVKPNPQYTNDPFSPIVNDGKLFGLGSNDAGGCLVSLIATFLHFYSHNGLAYNLVLAASAEEEVSGYNGIEALLKEARFREVTHNAFNPDVTTGSCAIVGEPTLMNLAIVEKGLMVLDCVANGKAGHAAREEGENAIYKAITAIDWFRTYRFEKVSEWLGPVKMSVTVVETENKAHNMVPAICRFVVDVRIIESYSHEEVLAIIRKHVDCEVTPRSMRMRATAISQAHPLVRAGIALGGACYGSPTSSDKALLPVPTLKYGPGDSARSHTADEFIFLEEIRNGIDRYIETLEAVL